MQIINKKGFTLIELLVVIAIIGILASIMVVSLTNAQKKARDAKRQSELNQLRTALTLYADDNNATYPGTSGTIQNSTADVATNPSIFNTTCTTSTTNNPICNEYMATSLATVGSLPYTYVFITGTPATYVAWVQLEAPPVTTYYCIDSAGKAGTTTTVPTNASTTCP